MPYCQECGNKVAANAKFCRNCGASQREETGAVAPVVTPPAPEPEKLKPEPKPKSKSRSKTAPKTSPEPGLPPELLRELPPEPPLDLPPEPRPEPKPARTCITCGKPVGPTEWVCGTCASEAEGKDQPAGSGPAPDVTPLQECTSCGTPVPESEALCGVCDAVSSVPSGITELINPADGAAPEGRTCRVCGNRIKPGDKFCGRCCAKVADALTAEAPVTPPSAASSPASPPLPIKAPVPAPAESFGGRTCRLCGNIIKPGAKFCGKCCAKVADAGPAEAPVALQSAAVSPPSSRPSPPTPIKAPVPAPAESFGGRTCRSCGNIIKPGDTFCGRCCAKVADVQGIPVSKIPAAQVATPSQVCASCGSPVLGLEKFCGICGSALPAVPEPSPALQPAGNSCGNCGAPINDAIKFCGGCGTPSDTAAPLPPSPVSPSPVMPAAAFSMGETVIGVIGNAKKMKMLGVTWDTYNLIVTDQRMILAQMSQEMINTAVREAQATAKADGKGFLSQMMHQMSAMFRYSERYVTMHPDQALAENKSNRGIGNRSISSIKLKLRESGSDGDYREFRMLIEAHEGKFEFTIAEDERFTNLLRQVYGDKVHMPPGYLSAGGVRIKLF